MSERRRMMMTSAGGGRLPSAYQEVEYIESNGTQYIDTGFSPTNNTTFESYAQFVTLTSAETALCGVHIGSPRSFFVRAQSGVIRISFGSGTNSGTSTELLDKIQYRLVQGVNELRLYYGGSSRAVAFNEFTVNAPLYLFAQNNATNPRYASLRLFSFDISESGVLERSFVPCYRKSDDKAGLYDLVGGQFYTDGNGGNFTVGGDV